MTSESMLRYYVWRFRMWCFSIYSLSIYSLIMSLNASLALKLKECYIALQSPEEQETLLHHLSELKDIISKFTNDEGSNVNDKGGEGEEDSEADGLQRRDQHARMVPAKKVKSTCICILN